MEPIYGKQNNSHARHFALVIGVSGALLASAWLSPSIMATVAPPPPLPPVPTATSTPIPRPTSPPVTGSFIELHVQFSQAWPWGEVHWQELWTIVQWQDGKGAWRNVEGWHGTLDSVVVEEESGVIGYKTWWVAEDDLGTGPFRWQVYRSPVGRLLAASEPFDLPRCARETTSVEVTLGP